MAEKQAHSGKPYAGNPLQVILWTLTLAAQAFAGSVTTTHWFVADDSSFHDAANWNPAEVPSGTAMGINAIVTNGTVRISQDASPWTLGIGTRGCANGIGGWDDWLPDPRASARAGARTASAKTVEH